MKKRSNENKNENGNNYLRESNCFLFPLFDFFSLSYLDLGSWILVLFPSISHSQSTSYHSRYSSPHSQ